MIKKVRNYFRSCYPHVNLSLSDEEIQQFMDQDHIGKLPSFEIIINYLYDYILSQDLCDVEE